MTIRILLMMKYTRTREEKFLLRGSVEMVLQCGSIDDYVDSLLGIKHHNDS